MHLWRDSLIARSLIILLLLAIARGSLHLISVMRCEPRSIATWWRGSALLLLSKLCPIFGILRESYSDAPGGSLKSEAAGRIHSVDGGAFTLVINKGNFLPLFVTSNPDFVETIKAAENTINLFLGYVLRDVAYVQGN